MSPLVKNGGLYSELKSIEMNLDMNRFQEELRMKKAFAEACLEQSLDRLDREPPLIHDAMKYALFNGGKRLRPIMVFEGAALAGGTKEQVIPAACAMEMIHCYSLVHDDLPAMDDDELRRGKPTCHIVFGEANAILAGDALLTAAFGLLAQNTPIADTKPERILRVIEEIARAAGSGGMIGGQVIDLQLEQMDVDLDTLKHLHHLKTGQLFRAAMKSGAILCGMHEEGVQALDQYAGNFGLAFQITDDILDIEGCEAVTGKPVGSDEKNHKPTYPSMVGMNRARQLAEEAVSACIANLQQFGPEADFLRDLARYVLLRNL